MPLQFEHIFAGIGMWGRKKQGDTLIQDGAIFVQKIAIGGMPRNRQFTQNFMCQSFAMPPGYSYHPNATTPLCSGNGGNGISVWRQHLCSLPWQPG